MTMSRRAGIILVGVLLINITAAAESGLVTLRSNHSVRETGNRLVTVLEEKGMKIVARINHAAGAASVDMQLSPTELLIFGNPKVGTPLMKCNRTVAIDLPQKMLIWQDESGVVWLAYNDPEFLGERHDLEGCEENLEKISAALANFAKHATGE
jgi:uncharacterized protein (DUF302 family)